MRGQARRTVHDTFAAPSSYLAPGGGPAVTVSARWSNKIGFNGDLEGDYTQVLEGIDRLAFDKAALVAAGVTLTKGGVVTLTPYDRSFVLDVKQTDTGPHREVWMVVDAVG